MAACGNSELGRSGVSVDTEITELTPDEASKMCEFIIGLAEQPERVIDCGNGQTTTVGINPDDIAEAIDNCVADLQAVRDSCEGNVGDFETCFLDSSNASDDVICSPILIQSCEIVASCS